MSAKLTVLRVLIAFSQFGVEHAVGSDITPEQYQQWPEGVLERRIARGFVAPKVEDATEPVTVDEVLDGARVAAAEIVVKAEEQAKEIIAKAEADAADILAKAQADASSKDETTGSSTKKKG